MKTNKKRIERLFPSVYITLISILLGFAVEDVVTQLREIDPIDAHSVLSAVGILSGIIAAWIGYSFVSMTQERMPRVFDAVHVFFLAFGFYLLNTTLGMEIWRFFAALFLMHGVAIFATVYNANILVQSISTSYDRRIFLRNNIVLLVGLIIYPIAAWISAKGMLPVEIELILVAYYTAGNIMWVYFFYHGWSRLMGKSI